MRRVIVALIALTGCASQLHSTKTDGDYLFVWAGAASKDEIDFLAVIDSDPQSPTYAEIVATAPTGFPRGGAHHTEHEMTQSGTLLANAFGSGRTFLFNLQNPRQPSVVALFGNAGEYMHAHSVARAPNGNVLATYQQKGHIDPQPGALAELSPTGEVLRVADAAAPAVDGFIRPYSLAVVPALDRVVTTSADMHAQTVSRVVQVWRLSDLKLIRTVPLPAQPSGKHNEDPAEPRVLSDGRTVVVSTFTCGLFLMKNLDGNDPSAEFIHSFSDTDACALPVVAGRYWVQTDASVPGLISLDMSDPRRPREVHRLVLAPNEHPHWIALAPDGERIVISGGGKSLKSKVLLARINRETGQMSLDRSFKPAGANEPGVSFDRSAWPHGKAGPAIPHGAVFNTPPRK